VREKVQQILQKALESAVSKGELAIEGELPVPAVELPRNPEHGDFATGVAMQLARLAKRKPRDIAEILVRHIEDPARILAGTEIAGPGFVNIRLDPSVWFRALGEVLEQGQGFGRAEPKGVKVVVEYVSANPTGPMHVGHGRGAVTGDVIATLLDWAGYDVSR